MHNLTCRYTVTHPRDAELGYTCRVKVPSRTFLWRNETGTYHRLVPAVKTLDIFAYREVSK